VIHADLDAHGMPGAREQLWVKQVGERRFVMRSLPFFTYGIAFADEVETTETLTLIRVLRRSGHRLLRVAVEREAAEQFDAAFHPLLESERLVHEWRGLGYVAIDLPPHRDSSRLTEWLEPRWEAGALHYEDGSRPLSRGAMSGGAAGRRAQRWSGRVYVPDDAAASSSERGSCRAASCASMGGSRR
jgi:Domain of unknown function (DUF4265)